MESIIKSEFPERTFAKVERLLRLAAEMNRHPDLKNKLAMFGGTAINLFMLNVPRLSVDIDISYIGSKDINSMIKERPIIERGLEEVGKSLNYNVIGLKNGHAGRTFVLRYYDDWGWDNIKIDIVYMNRVPLLPLKIRESKTKPGLFITVFDDVELTGGKIKAYFDRVKIRDLYDLYNLKKYFDLLNDNAKHVEITHKVLLFYASISARFPNSFLQREARFSNYQSELNKQLIPMLRIEENYPDLSELMLSAAEFINEYVLPKNDMEKEYLTLFSQGIYKPELLFQDSNILTAAQNNPEANWKLQNLRKIKV